jgi:lambda repressor-like predicted transcriptional regulator
MNKSILERIKDSNDTVRAISKRMNVNRSVVYQSIEGNGSRRIRVEIATVLKTAPSELWPMNNQVSNNIDDALYAVGFADLSWMYKDKNNEINVMS